MSRLCLDQLKSARHRREKYVGTWLPEPIVAEPAQTLADDLSVALLMALERLSPLERAAFLLHDVFDMDYAGVAATLETSEAACRQLASRAREHVQQERPRHAISDARRPADSRRRSSPRRRRATSAPWRGCWRTTPCSTPTAAESDARRSIRSSARTGSCASTKACATKFGAAAFSAQRVEETTLNGLPGFVFHTAEGTETVAFEIANGVVVAIYNVRNPDKVKAWSKRMPEVALPEWRKTESPLTERFAECGRLTPFVEATSQNWRCARHPTGASAYLPYATKAASTPENTT